jgi:hypothetical protein
MVIINLDTQDVSNTKTDIFQVTQLFMTKFLLPKKLEIKET